MGISHKTRLFGTVAAAAMLANPAFAQQEVGAGAQTYLGQVVFGAGAEKVAIDVPQAVSVLDEETIEQEAPETVGDVIENVPGVTTVGSESFFGESLNIRGIGQGASADEPKIVMTIDGVGKYYEQYRMGSMFTDPVFFKRIEVLRGPASSTLHGSGAIGGVVAMETKDAADFIEDDQDSFAFFQKLEYKSNGKGKLSTSVLAFRPNEQLDFMAGFNYRDSELVQDGNGDDIAGTEGELKTFVAKGTYRFGNDLAHSIEASYLSTRSSVKSQPYNLVDSTVDWGTVDRDIEDTTAYLRYGYNPADNDLIDLSVQLSYANTEVKMSNGRNLFIAPADYAYETFTVKAENRAEWSGASYENFLTVGISHAKQDRRAQVSEVFTSAFGPPIPTQPGSGFSYHPEAETKTLSFYAQNEFVWNDRLTVIAGGRLDKQDTVPNPATVGPATLKDTSNTASSASLALHYKLNDNWAVFGSASYTERLPTVDEIYDTRSGLASFDLTPESSKNFELGLSFEQNDLFTDGDQLTMKAVAFRNNMDGQIVSNTARTSVNGRIPGKINLGETRIEGIELEAAYDSDRVFGALAYSKLSGENLSDPTGINADLANVLPADNVALTLGFRPVDTVELSWRVSHSSSVEYQSVDRMTRAISTVTSDAHTVHDIFASWKPDSGVLDGAELRLGVHNVFDLDYKTHLASSSAKKSGRQITFGLSKTF